MKKEIKILTLIIIIIIVSIMCTCFYIADKARIANNTKPIFCIEIKDTNKSTTYLGLGYKVYRYKSTYDNSEVYKIGLWGLKYNNPYNESKKMTTPLPVIYSYFSNANEGIIIGAGDQAMGTYAVQVYSTKDGGKTWELRMENEGRSISVSINAQYLFINDKIGFIFNPSRSEMNANLLMTKDGGKTFDAIKFVDTKLISPFEGAVQIPKNEVYDYYELPTYKNGILTVVVSQGIDGDFNGGKTVLEYSSKDFGDTWNFTKEYAR